MKTGIKITLTVIISAALLCGCNSTAKNPTSSGDSSDTVSYVSSPESNIPESTDNSSVSETTSEPVPESSVPESSVSESSAENSIVSRTESSEIPVSSETSADMPYEHEFRNKYFVNKLSKSMLKNFTDAYNAVSDFERSVTFEQPITSDELDTIMFLLNYDCPELVQISGDYFPEYIDLEQKTVSAVSFSYIMDEKQHKKAIRQLDSFFVKLKKNTADMTELQKEKYVYDYIFNNCVYNETDTMSGSAYGALIKHKGRCEAICKSFMWCMRELGIECMCVSGEQNWNTESLYSSHSWNIVKINGEYYHLDLTVDCLPVEDGEKCPPNYGFFNVDDSFVSEGRKIYDLFTSLGVPKCNSLKYNYHIMNGLYVDSKTDIEQEFYNILNEHFNNGLDNISIKFRNTYDFELMVENCDDWIVRFLNSVSTESFDYQYYYYDFSNTITIYAAKSE